jgi:hypothetical protein
VIGRNSHILKQLKINLLDVESALPEEALRSSKSQEIRRRSWRAFVKDAESISQVCRPIYLLDIYRQNMFIILVTLHVLVHSKLLVFNVVHNCKRQNLFLHSSLFFMCWNVMRPSRHAAHIQIVIWSI